MSNCEYQQQQIKKEEKKGLATQDAASGCPEITFIVFIK